MRATTPSALAGPKRVSDRVVIARSSSGRRGRLPDFLIVGAPRSGTTALSDYLRAHSGVFVPIRKELNFFDRGDPSPTRLDWYARQFRHARRGQMTGEATPTYLFSSEAVARMARVVPDARLIALLRNPVDRAYSHYWLCRLVGAEHRSFEQAIRDELSGRASPGLEYIAYGNYLEQLKRILDHYPRSSLLVLAFDDLQTDAQSVFASSCTHIGVDPHEVPAIVGKRINAARRHRSTSLWRAMERWRSSGRRGLAVAGLIARRNTVSFAPPPMEAHVRRILTDHYSQDVAALSGWLDRDLSAWQS